MKKSHSKLSKNEPEISHKLRSPDTFAKGFKKEKIDFWQKVTLELVKSSFWYLFKPVNYV